MLLLSDKDMAAHKFGPLNEINVHSVMNSVTSHFGYDILPCPSMGVWFLIHQKFAMA